MTRDEVLQLVRDHLADELGIDPEAIAEGARFKEDLGADSLDLYTLTQELEDTYGVKIPEADAVDLTTVALAVDYVSRLAPGQLADR
jgi:acyl carrier protein